MANESLSTRILKSSEELLDQLILEVGKQESVLSGGTKLVPGVEELKRLKETRVSFGSPYQKLKQLPGETFKQLGDRFDFYYMTLSVSMQPGRGVQFTRLECHLDFGPKGESEPIVQRIFPRSEWREILRLGSTFNLALDGNLDWAVEIDASEMIKVGNFPADLKGKIANKNELKAYIAVPDYSYELGKTEIAATGEGNSECFWRIDKPALQKAQTVQFAVVFNVPKGKMDAELTGIVFVEPDFKWLTSNLGDVFDYLSDKMKGLLRMKDRERKGNHRLPVGAGEKWTLTLPKE